MCVCVCVCEMCVVRRIAKDPRFERLPCLHKGTYADDCLVNRVTQVYRVNTHTHARTHTHSPAQVLPGCDV